MINGKGVGLDAFGKPGTFSKIFKKLLESYTLDAIDWHDPDKEHKALKSEVTKFQKAALVAGAEGRPSVGLGTDFRMESRKVTGFALALKINFFMSPSLPAQMAETHMRRIHGSRGSQGEGGIEGFRASNDQFLLTFKGVNYKQQSTVFPNQCFFFQPERERGLKWPMIAQNPVTLNR